MLIQEETILEIHRSTTMYPNEALLCRFVQSDVSLWPEGDTKKLALEIR